MCGFVATISPHVGTSCLWAAKGGDGLNLLAHRGPDKCGSIATQLSWCQASLGMARLTITDTRNHIEVPGFWDDIFLAYNGEIYNHRELKDELCLETNSQCDAEVVARAWRKLGPGLLDRLNGMFAFVLVDTLRDEVFLARDRAGEKPLFYAAYEDRLYIASEMKALPIPLWERVCVDMETLDYDCLDETPFENVVRLPPGHVSKLTRREHLRQVPSHRWWALPQKQTSEFKSVEEAGEALEPLLVDAIKIRAETEVPCAVQLSGGLDSAIIQAVVGSKSLYTISFPADGVDNLSMARRAAGLGREPIEVTFGAVEAKDSLRQVAWHLDSPGTWTAVAQWFLMEAIAADGNKVCLSGEGADELFLGYTRYRLLWHLWETEMDPKCTEYMPTWDYLVGDNVSVMAKMLDRGRTPDSLARARAIVHMFASERSLPRKMAHVDFHSTMQVLLRMADRMAAAHSIENRSPFLDYRVMEFGARLPLSLCITPRGNKDVLREVAARLGVVDEIVHERTKKGLFIPWPKWYPSKGPRGVWERGSFRTAMLEAWREVYDSRRDRPPVCFEACLKLP